MLSRTRSLLGYSGMAPVRPPLPDRALQRRDLCSRNRSPDFNAFRRLRGIYHRSKQQLAAHEKYQAPMEISRGEADELVPSLPSQTEAQRGQPVGVAPN